MELITDIIENVEAQAQTQLKANGDHSNVVEALQFAEDKWTRICQDLCAASLFARTDSWIFEGKSLFLAFPTSKTPGHSA